MPLQKTVGGKLYQITPATAYTSADLDWNNKSSRSSIEMTTENSRPELGGEALNLKDYDVIFLVTRYGGIYVRVRSIHSLRNMISPVKPLFHLLLPEEAQ